MANLADAFSGVMNVLDMPGSYTRGALAGRFGERLSGSQLLNSYTKPLGFETDDGIGTFAADMGIGMVTDPLSLLLPGAAALGTKGAQAAGRGVGKWLATNAAKRGPQYATKMDDLLPLLPDMPMSRRPVQNTSLNQIDFNTGEKILQEAPDWQSWRKTMAAYPEVAKEIPPGSVPIGGRTAEALVFHHPQTGQITKVTSPRLTDRIVHGGSAVPEPRLNVADMLQPSRSKLFTKGGEVPPDMFPSLRVEHEPFMEVGKVPKQAFPQMATHLKGQGVDPWDIFGMDGANPGNLGTSPTGQIFVTDAGAIRAMPDAAIPMAQSIEGEASPLAAAILRLTGGGNRMQRELAKQAGIYRGGIHGTPFSANLDEMEELARMAGTPIVKPLSGTMTPNFRGR